VFCASLGFAALALTIFLDLLETIWTKGEKR
jgi:hypothetical protein